MYYIEETDTEVIKYEVEIDKDNLLKLKEKIIDECSAIEHKKTNQVEGLLEPSFFEGRDIRNYKERRIGRKEYFDGPDEDIYEIEYDEYHHTDIVRYTPNRPAPVETPARARHAPLSRLCRP